MLAIHNATASQRLTTAVRSALKMWYAEPLQLDVEPADLQLSPLRVV